MIGKQFGQLKAHLFIQDKTSQLLNLYTWRCDH